MTRPRSTPADAAPTERPFDIILFGCVVALMVIGTLEIFSSSAIAADRKFDDSMFFLKRQLIFLGLGGFMLWLGTRIDYRALNRNVYPLLLLSLILLTAVLFTREINGARRWFMFGPVSIQPVEIAKVALIAYLSHSLARKGQKVKTFSIGFVPHLIVCAIMMMLLLKQPDLGSSIVLGAITLGLLFVAGARLSYILYAILVALPIAYHFIVGTPWRMNRMMAFLNPEAYRHAEGFQAWQARIGLANGGGTGRGLGEGYQKLGYLMESHNDFIMAPIGEELGWLGFCGVLLLFGVIIWRGIRAAIGARDTFGMYLAFGISLMIGLQVVIHTGVVLGALPAKGITLPFVSYGGSSLMISLFLVGLLLNIGRQRPPRRSPKNQRERAAAARFRRPKAVIVCDS